MTVRQAGSFKLPDERPVTMNEMEWLRFIRMITDDRDPAPSLRMVQALRCAWAESQH